jgi:hypothetical protein
MPHGRNTNEAMALLQYASIILLVLSICYVIVITNPPKDLLEYNENLKDTVTRQLSSQEIPNFAKDLLPFFGIFSLMMFFCGYSLSLILVNRIIKIEAATIPYLFTCGSILALGAILWPYYGDALAMIVLYIGAPSFIAGVLSNLYTIDKSFTVNNHHISGVNAIRLFTALIWIFSISYGALSYGRTIGLILLFFGIAESSLVEISYRLGTT